MFKKIPGTHFYQINRNGEIIDHHARTVQLESAGTGTVKIVLFGKQRVVEKRWLLLFAWYECWTIKDLEQHFEKIKFFPANPLLKIKSGYMMQFTEHIHYSDDFIYIPSFPRYAINIQGHVIDTLTNKDAGESRDQAGYIDVYIRSPDKSTNKHTKLHRLMALAWLPNDDFINRPFVNHINGDKGDYGIPNLEWCSASENAQHAINAGLVDCNVLMKARDVVTGKIEIFNSVADLSRKLGLSRGYSSVSFTDRLPGFLYKKRYEIKRNDDESPWLYEGRDFDDQELSKQYLDITIINKRTGDTVKFTKLRKFINAYKLWPADGISSAVEIFKQRYSDMDVSYSKNIISGPYRIINIKTDSITVVSSIEKASAMTGRNKNELNSDLRRKRKFIYPDGWIVIPGNSVFDKNEYQVKEPAFRGLAIVNALTGEVKNARSIKFASRLTKVTAKAIAKSLKSGLPVRGSSFSFRPL